MALEVAFDNFSFRYSPHTPEALKKLSIRVEAGSTCAFLGPTHAGKSTLLQSVAGILGLHHQTSRATGSIRVGDDTFDPLPKNVLFPTIGLVLQDPYVQISGVRETVHDEVAFTLENLDIPAERRAQRVTETLQMLGIDHLASRKPTQLSGGELQRVALATILVAKPEVLLLDEPTTSLDHQGQLQLIHIVRRIKKSTTVVLADTAIDFALSVADLFVVLDGGTVIFSGQRSDFLHRLPDFTRLLPIGDWQDVITGIRSAAGEGVRMSRRLTKLVGLS